MKDWGNMKLLIDTNVILEAQMDRQNGYQGRNARDVYADMKRVIAETEIMLECQP